MASWSGEQALPGFGCCVCASSDDSGCDRHSRVPCPALFPLQIAVDHAQCTGAPASSPSRPARGAVMALKPTPGDPWIYHRCGSCAALILSSAPVLLPAVHFSSPLTPHTTFHCNFRYTNFAIRISQIPSRAASSFSARPAAPVQTAVAWARRCQWTAPFAAGPPSSSPDADTLPARPYIFRAGQPERV